MSSGRDRKVLAAMKDKGGTSAEIAARCGMPEAQVLGTLQWLLSKTKPRVKVIPDGWEITGAGREFLAKG